MTAIWSRLRLPGRRAQRRKDASKVLLEDALKRLHAAERSGRSGTVASLAAGLGIAEQDVAGLVADLKALELVRVTAGKIGLTGRGRRSATRVLRSHRLWEQYLAQRTGAEPASWHAAAERMEHRLSEEETETLDLRLGRPLFDPHGDPIPSRAGELPAPLGVSLSRLGAGESADVIHIEDEPPEVFERLVRQGFAPGRDVQVLEAEAGWMRVRVAGQVRRLDEVTASNVTVEPLPAGSEAGGPCRTLADAALGEAVIVRRLSPECRGPSRRRLLDLGFVPGTRIVPELESSAGDPVAYRLRGALIGLRREQAASVEIEAGDPR